VRSETKQGIPDDLTGLGLRLNPVEPRSDPARSNAFSMTYAQRLQQRIDSIGSQLCVGIDPRPDRHESVDALEAFCSKVITETADRAATFKPNIAYFEALGVSGYAALSRLIKEMKSSGALVILDAKRGDIGTTQEHYAKGYFEGWDVDAVTLSPYMGFDSIEPFLGRAGKGVYLLGVTSNQGAADLETQSLADGRLVFELVGDLCERAAPGEAGMVLGLTNASADVLSRLPDVPLLIPGLGAQGGDLESLRDQSRSAPSVINVSRGILYPETGDFSSNAKTYADRIAAVLS
ncbi:MAG: orotidine-5'-phosphate decarboxylase, partial [Verrucomicrobiota bacterium]